MYSLGIFGSCADARARVRVAPLTGSRNDGAARTRLFCEDVLQCDEPLEVGHVAIVLHDHESDRAPRLLGLRDLIARREAAGCDLGLFRRRLRRHRGSRVPVGWILGADLEIASEPAMPGCDDAREYRRRDDRDDREYRRRDDRDDRQYRRRDDRDDREYRRRDHRDDREYRRRRDDRGDDRYDDRQRYRRQHDRSASPDRRERTAQPPAANAAPKRATSGIFGYLAQPAKKPTTSSSDAAATEVSAGRRAVPDAHALKRILDGEERTAAWHEARRLQRAETRPAATGIAVVRTSELVDADGAVLRDGFSSGLRPDVAAEKEKPYVCKHDGKSFVTATQLSDYLRTRYGENIHASLLRPRPPKTALIEMSGGDEHVGASVEE